MSHITFLVLFTAPLIQLTFIACWSLHPALAVHLLTGLHDDRQAETTTDPNTDPFTFYHSLTPTAQPLYSVTGLEPELPSAHLNTPVIECEGGGEMTETAHPFWKSCTAAAVKYTKKPIYDWTEEDERANQRRRAVVWPLNPVYKCWQNSHLSLFFTFLSSALISLLLCCWTSICLQLLLPWQRSSTNKPLHMHEHTHTLSYLLT